MTFSWKPVPSGDKWGKVGSVPRAVQARGEPAHPATATMASFKGQASYSVDSKGRIAIPAKMRASLTPAAKGSFTLTRGFDRCVSLYPLDAWEQREAELAALNQYERESRDFVRSVLMWADEATLDGQGRIPLPRHLMEFAGISEKALIIGALDHIEIWDPEVFGRYLEQQSSDYETLAEKVMGR